MKTKKKLKLKRFNLHPVTSFIILTIFVMMISSIFSLFEMQTTYSQINETTSLMDKVLVVVTGMFNYDGFKFLISNSLKNFISFTPLSTLLISLIGIGIVESTGMIETITKKRLKKLPDSLITFIIIFLATISSLINEVGYSIMIPLAALIFLYRGRNPLLGITAAFSGVAFGYGTTIFVGSLDVSLIPYTTSAARLIDTAFHVSLTSNLIIMVVSSIILSIVGTIIIEKIIIKAFGKYTVRGELIKTQEIKIITEEHEKAYEQQQITDEKNRQRGLKYARNAAIAVLIIFIYMLIPKLPGSGLLLDTTEKTYVNQLFGANAYFQDGFTYMVSLFFIITGIFYGIGAKKINSDRSIINGYSKYMTGVMEIILLLFVASQFAAIFKKTNIGTVICGLGANIISDLSFSGISLILLVIVVIAISNIFVTTPTTKWSILSPVIVPLMMQSNISPQFAQFIFRASESITNGITPMLASFVIYLGFLNVYNDTKENPIGIKKAIGYIIPYFLIITATWILLIIGWYLLGLPIGSKVYPTL